MINFSSVSDLILLNVNYRMVVVLVAGIYRAYIKQVSNHNDNFLLLAKMLNKMLEKFNDAVKVETGAN